MAVTAAPNPQKDWEGPISDCLFVCLFVFAKAAVHRLKMIQLSKSVG